MERERVKGPERGNWGIKGKRPNGVRHSGGKREIVMFILHRCAGVGFLHVCVLIYYTGSIGRFKFFPRRLPEECYMVCRTAVRAAVSVVVYID
ncbi:hypothetical protein L228DRAFT_142270 [Xylona heveae TC161]|uniref:Uncharacterized protein n=1 Tax=Xylona heveae (strain CBS 132557 / TC161) TaxID=1328760 RepID=A0A165H6A4_XYLHT|nr:hypothetical protein L228DRAFT_142270 [Xylona heveae TC161]KZF23048.1 hypothetical protein L228DRAFT_142270 [Xylona heveae TC161]